MQQINCNINNCSHNKSGICYSSRTDIGGGSVLSQSGTWCNSFSSKNLHNSLNNNASTDSQCGYLTCEVKKCIHNTNTLCNLQSINVLGSKSQIYAQTKCSSFNLNR